MDMTLKLFLTVFFVVVMGNFYPSVHKATLTERDGTLTRVNLELKSAQVKTRHLSVCPLDKEIVFPRQDLLKTKESELRSAQVENSKVKYMINFRNCEYHTKKLMV